MSHRCMQCMKEYDEKYDVCPYCGYFVHETANEAYQLQPETIIGKRYVVGAVIGSGGFGITYVGWDALLEQKIAIKEYFPNEFCSRSYGENRVIPYSGLKEEQFLAGKEKFLSESKCLSKLSDVEGIVKIQECFEENNTAYIIMEYLEGETLKSMIERNGIIEVETAISMIKPVLEALELVHNEGIIHRDIAPDNIFITTEGKLKIIDFGASRFATTKHSKSLSIVLKQGYSPEEQYRSKGEQGTWTDVYAVAATFYKMITGVTPEDALERNAKDNLKPPSRLGIKISKSTENSIMNALNVKVEGRTKTVREFYNDLEAEEVKRVKIKTIKKDIGQWPVWVKIATSTACAAIVAFFVLLMTGVIQFHTKKAGANYLPEGYTRVPNVINMTNQDAQSSCEVNKIVLQVYGKEYSDHVESDLVLGQQLYGGSIVEENTTLLVLMSAGQKQNLVPDVVGMMEEDAIELLEQVDLIYKSVYIESCIKPGAVCTQSLNAGELVDAGTSIDIEVSKGMNYDTSADTVVPELRNTMFEEAKDIVKESALYIYKSASEYNDSVPKGAVISQSPEAGTVLKQGDVVEVIISLGAETVLVPDVQYTSVKDAEKILKDAGLTVQIEYQDSEVVIKDSVISQSLEPNTFVNKNASITIYVSNGNEKADISNIENVQTDAFVTQEQQAKYDQETQASHTITADNKKDEKKDEIAYAPVEEVKMVTMPSVVGRSESDALSALSGQGLNGSVTYSHNESSASGTVLSQNIASGSQVAKGSYVVLTVCNNEKKTQYRKRTITEEKTTSSSSQLDGWTMYDKSTSWSDYGSWSEWSTTDVSQSDSKKVETKTEYRYRKEETTSSSSSSMSGWTLTGQAVTSYTAWSGNQTTTTKPTESDTLQITNTSTTTTYNYYHYDNKYTDGTQGIDSVASGSGNGYTISKNYAYHTYSTTTPLSQVPVSAFSDVGGKQGYGSHACSYRWNYWFLSGSSSTTTYTYQTRSPIYTYYYKRWTDWSAWSSNTPPITNGNGAEVEQRVLYRYATRSQITTYHHKRNVYGEWSEWSDTAYTAGPSLDVETREVFLY